jgi:hypothetical protein
LLILLLEPRAETLGDGDIDRRGVHAGLELVVAEDDFGDAVAEGDVGFMLRALGFSGTVQEEDEWPLFVR